MRLAWNIDGMALAQYLALPFYDRWTICDELNEMMEERAESGDEDPTGILSGRPKRTRK